MDEAKMVCQMIEYLATILVMMSILSMIIDYKFALPSHPARSLLRRENADINGLSWMLLPRFPLRPHLFASPTSSFSSIWDTEKSWSPLTFLLAKPSRRVEGRDPGNVGVVTVTGEPLPKMEETDD